jgi:hypothetical protein
VASVFFTSFTSIFLSGNHKFEVECWILKLNVIKKDNHNEWHCLLKLYVIAASDWRVDTVQLAPVVGVGGGERVVPTGLHK